MQVEEIIKQVNDIFRRELDNDDITVKYETTANDVEEWDSLSHIMLVVAIEKHFKIKFTAGEIQSFKNVGEMCEAIAKKVVANFVTRMWEAGHVDDETYATEMEKVVVTSSRMKAARDKAIKEGKDGPPAEDRAMGAWSMHYGIDDGAEGDEIPGPEPDDSVDPGFISDFQKRYARIGHLDRRNNARSLA